MFFLGSPGILIHLTIYIMLQFSLILGHDPHSVSLSLTPTCNVRAVAGSRPRPGNPHHECQIASRRPPHHISTTFGPPLHDGMRYLLGKDGDYGIRRESDVFRAGGQPTSHWKYSTSYLIQGSRSRSARMNPQDCLMASPELLIPACLAQGLGPCCVHPMSRP